MVFDPLRKSNEIKIGARSLFGVGLTTGFTGESDIPVGDKWKMPVAALMDSIDRGWDNAIGHYSRPKRLSLNVPLISRLPHAVDITTHEDAQQFIRHFQMSINADEFKRARMSSEGVDKFMEMVEQNVAPEDMNELLWRVETGNPRLPKTFQNIIAHHGTDSVQILDDAVTLNDPIKLMHVQGIGSKIAQKVMNIWKSNYKLSEKVRGMHANNALLEPSAIMQDMVEGIQDIFHRGAMEELKYKDFHLLGPNYATRVPLLAKDGMMIMSHFLAKNSKSVEKFSKRFGLWNPYELFGGGNPFFQVQNLSQLGRAEEMPQFLRNLYDHAVTLIPKLEGQGLMDEVTELKDTMRFLEKVDRLYGFSKKLGPMGFNREFKTLFKDDVAKFLTTKEGKLSGFKSADDFKIYSENIRDILRVRGARTAQTTAVGEGVAAFRDVIAVKEGSAEHKGLHSLIAAREGHTIANKRIVSLNTGLRKALGVSPEKADALLGKMAEGYVTTQEGVDVLAEVFNAWTRVKSTTPAWRYWDKLQNFWARSTLFGGRVSYLFNNFIGDAWNAFLAGVSPNHFFGGSAFRIMLPEGRTLPGIGGIVGATMDQPLLVSRTTGMTYTKRQILDWISGFEVDGGMLESDIYIARNAFGKRMEKEPKGAGLLFNMDSFKAGDVSPWARQAGKFSEKFRRYSTFMHFLENGLSPLDAADMVWKYHFNYNRQNDMLRRFFPFYFWTANNVPLQFKNFLMKPAKMSIPYKVQKNVDQTFRAMANGDDPTIEGTPEYIRASGMWIGEHGGKDIYLDYNNLPPYAAMELVPFLGNGGGNKWLQRAASASSPIIQLVAEEIFNQDIFSGRRIRGGGTGVISETGTKKFMGQDIQGQPLAQTAVHIGTTLYTPLQLLDNMYENTIDDLPTWVELGRYIGGAPIREVNRASTEWINVARERNILMTKLKHYRAVGQRQREARTERDIEILNKKLTRLGREIDKQERTKKYEKRMRYAPAG